MLDTNIFVSGIHWRGIAWQILQAWLAGRFTLILSLPILHEIAYVLSTFRIPLSTDQLTWWKALIVNNSIVVDSVQRITIIKRDPSDNKFLEAAVAGNAQYIVSQDRHLLDLGKYRGIRIVHPRQFLRILRRRG